MSDEAKDTDDRPLYSRRRKNALRAVVIIAVGAMLLPLVASLFTVNISTADAACAQAVAYAVPDAASSSARFEVFGPGGIGWECYAVGGFSGDQFVVSLGLIPGMVEIPRGVRS